MYLQKRCTQFIISIKKVKNHYRAALICLLLLQIGLFKSNKNIKLHFLFYFYLVKKFYDEEINTINLTFSYYLNS
jgi:hypothetical protein